jgi:hypothetical protein
MTPLPRARPLMPHRENLILQPAAGLDASRG